MPYLTKEKKAGFFADFGGKSTNTGSIEGQIALLTERINRISEHLASQQKRFLHSSRPDAIGREKKTFTDLPEQA